MGSNRNTEWDINTCYKLYKLNKHLMTSFKGNGEFCFPETLRYKGKQKSLFPEGPVIKYFVIPPDSKLEKNCKKKNDLLWLCLQYERQSNGAVLLKRAPIYATYEMTSYAGHIWILFTSILLFFGAHAKPSEWACSFIKWTRAGETRQCHLGRFDVAIFNCHFPEVCYGAQAVSPIVPA